MEIFRIKQDEELPGVIIDYNQGLIEFSGKSVPEDPIAFFVPIDAAIKQYIANPQPTTTINLKIEYMNSASQKKVLEILAAFEKLTNKQHNITINWFYPEDDEDLREEGKELARILKTPLHVLPI
jgi:hypothetical protein